MENPEEILHSLEEFSKMKPKDIPRELEEYLCFVAKTGDPVYQWSTIKSLFREKLINVITEFYETCPSVEIPPCPNVEMFNYESMKTFILEKLDTFAAAPFTVQRICELLTTPRKEYNRIDKYMRALEKNILVVSTTEPGGGRRSAENGEGIMNGIESEHLPESSNCSHEINVEEMDDSPSWSRLVQTASIPYQNENEAESQPPESTTESQTTPPETTKANETATTSSSPPPPQETVITCRNSEEPYVSIEPVPSNTCTHQESAKESSVESVTITAIPAGVQKRRSSVEPVIPESSTTEEQQPATETIPQPFEFEDDKKETEEESKPDPDEEEQPKESISTIQEEPVADEIVTTETTSGIENISPESSTSPPENLEVVVKEADEPSPPLPEEEEHATTTEDVSKSENTTTCSDDTEITSTIVETKEADTSEDSVGGEKEPELVEENVSSGVIVEESSSSSSSTEETTAVQPISSSEETPMEVDVVTDKVEEEVTGSGDVVASDSTL